MDKKVRIALAKRKLKEFHRWQNVAVFWDDISVSDNWIIGLYSFNPNDYADRLHEWQREAPNEVNEIINAVNAIQKEHCRAILIMSFLERPKRSTAEQMEVIGRKSAQYSNLKNLALLEFASLYRDGLLLTYSED